MALASSGKRSAEGLWCGMLREPRSCGADSPSPQILRFDPGGRHSPPIRTGTLTSVCSVPIANLTRGARSQPARPQHAARYFRRVSPFGVMRRSRRRPSHEDRRTGRALNTVDVRLATVPKTTWIDRKVDVLLDELAASSIRAGPAPRRRHPQRSSSCCGGRDAGH